ncbi:hypothetical protein TNCT_447941 [Trichonephila clavata]|uniref:Uncharacterized protein n=1 Tax=Trichonephila clavata TaxID=2740835 RepID=A0A8X6H644_TRICU|nr:hypothetical protein TNCT_447941 [Trichonephila clavata]
MTGTDEDPLRKYNLTRMSRKISSKKIPPLPPGDFLSTPQQSQPPLVICKTCGLQDRKYFLVTYGLKYARTGWYCTLSPTNRAESFLLWLLVAQLGFAEAAFALWVGELRNKCWYVK